MAIVVNLDVQLAKSKMSVTQLADAVGITVANISILKNARAKAVRLTTLDAICRVLSCQPGDILEWVPNSGESQSTLAQPREPAFGEGEI